MSTRGSAALGAMSVHAMHDEPAHRSNLRRVAAPEGELRARPEMWHTSKTPCHPVLASASPRGFGRESGVIFIWVLVSFFVLAVLLMAAVQPASIIMKREREKDLVFRGEEYVEAIRLYQSEHGGAFPTKMEQLIQTGPKQHRYIRKLWENPFDPQGKWTLLGPGVTVVTMGEDGKPVFTTSGIGQGINQGISQGGIRTGEVNTTAATQGHAGTGQGLQPGTPGEVLPFKVGGEEGQPILGVCCRLHEKAFSDLRGKDYYDEWFFSPLVMPPPPPAGVRTLPQVQPGQTPRPTSTP